MILSRRLAAPDAATPDLGLSEASGYSGASMIRPSSSHRLVLYLVFGALWLSGFLFLGLRWFDGALFSISKPRGDWGSLLMEVHAAVAFLFLVVLGSLKEHISRAWPTIKKRRSGTLMLCLFVSLPVSAWFLYYAVDDGVRLFTVVLHSVIGMGILVVLGGHVWTYQRPRL